MITKAFIVANDTVFAQFPDAVQGVENGVVRGGYVFIGKVGVWNALLVVSPDTKFDELEQSAGNGMVVLGKLNEHQSGLEVDLDQSTLDRLNTWLTARGFPTETRRSRRQTVRRLFRRFFSDFEPEFVDVN